MSTSTAGRAREHRVRNNLIQHGWRPLMRAAASKGSADLAMIHPIYGLALIQVGGPGKTLGPDERERLCEDAADAGALAILATTHPGIGIRYRQITNTTPATWPTWNPDGEP